MGVLKAVLYAHNALGSSLLQSFMFGLIVFSRMAFICLFDTSTCPDVCGWYGVAILCLTPSFFSNPFYSIVPEMGSPIAYEHSW